MIGAWCVLVYPREVQVMRQTWLREATIHPLRILMYRKPVRCSDCPISQTSGGRFLDRPSEFIERRCLVRPPQFCKRNCISVLRTFLEIRPPILGVFVVVGFPFIFLKKTCRAELGQSETRGNKQNLKKKRRGSALIISAPPARLITLHTEGGERFPASANMFFKASHFSLQRLQSPLNLLVDIHSIGFPFSAPQ